MGKILAIVGSLAAALGIGLFVRAVNNYEMPEEDEPKRVYREHGGILKPAERDKYGNIRN